MLKFLLLMALAGIVWWIWQKRDQSADHVRRPEPPPERMVACAHCGVHMPESDSISGDGRYYCCEAHRRAGMGSRSS